MDDKSLIVVKQLPIIEENLKLLKSAWGRKATDAESMVCTDDTVKAVKSFRSEMRKEFEDVEALRKSAKQAVMDPYMRFEAVYKDCVTEPFRRADSACARKIAEVENEIKDRCEAELREYFSELCSVHHIDWLEFERTGIKVDMASARSKTPKRLREQLTAFVVGVSESVDRISLLEDANEIMVEYKRTLDAAGAICTVSERHRRIEEQKAEQEVRREEREMEEEMVRRVEALAPPVVADEPEPVLKCAFTVHATKTKLKKLKEFLIKEGIKYE